jgi:hypothetical protein
MNRNGQMNMREKRSLALGAVRSQLRRMGLSLEDGTVPFEQVLAVLDDLSRAEPDLVASQWYRQASDHQISTLRREWAGSCAARGTRQTRPARADRQGRQTTHERSLAD